MFIQILDIINTFWYLILLFLLVVWILAAKIIWRKWGIEAIIIEKRGSNLIKTNDRAGRYTDKYTGITGYRLKKSKDTIPVYNFDWILHNIAVPTTFLDKIINMLRGNSGTIFLFKYGSKQYKPVHIKEADGNKVVLQEIKDRNGNIAYINIYQPFDVRDKMGTLDFEVVDWDNMNFMVQEQRASILRRQKKGEFLKQIIVPLVMMIVTGLVCIVMFKFSVDYASSHFQAPTNNQNAVQGGTEDTASRNPNIPIIGDLMPSS